MLGSACIAVVENGLTTATASSAEAFIQPIVHCFWRGIMPARAKSRRRSGIDQRHTYVVFDARMIGACSPSLPPS